MDIVDRIIEEFGPPQWVISIFLLLLLIDALSPGASKLAQLLAWGMRAVRSILHLPQTEEQKQWARSYKMFAEALASRIRSSDVHEDWRDNRFAELDVEVEAEGRQRFLGILARLLRPAEGLRRERSLTQALELSRERLILLEGDPGSGKSVALRHVALLGLDRAIKSKSTQLTIPIYINLKELDAKAEDVSPKIVKEFILTTLRRSTTSDLDKFLDSEFDNGIRDGTWFFLFDSFDEIPEVLSSTYVDPIIESYANAIYGFLHELNACRGIVASRTFRSPRGFGWPRFRIVPLSQKRKHELVSKALLKKDLTDKLMRELLTAELGIQKLSSNPLFLGLLCEYTADRKESPNSVHTVFDAYIERRLSKYEPYLQERYRMGRTEVRSIAEQLAFAMSAASRLGLSPPRKELLSAMAELGFPKGRRINTAMDALEYIKLARSEGGLAADHQRSFTFAHRRFQEYFATCIVLGDLGKVSPHQLLTDGRWRETAVSILQLQPPDSLQSLMEEAANILKVSADTLPPVPNLDNGDSLPRYPAPSTEDGSERVDAHKSFSWPEGILHVLGILDSGFASRGIPLPPRLQDYTSRLFAAAFFTGQLYDKKWALEVAGPTPLPVRTWLIRSAFQSRSEWLKEVAYRQISRFPKVPFDVAVEIRKALATLSASGRLRRDKLSVTAPIMRLDEARDFLQIVKLLLLTPIVDFAANIAVLAMALRSVGQSWLMPTFLFLASVASFYMVRLNTHFATRKSFTGWRERVAGISDVAGPFVMFYVRGFFIFIAIPASRSWWVYAGWALLNTYLLSWSVAALESARTGAFRHTWQLPLVHLLILGELLGGARRIVQPAFKGRNSLYTVGGGLGAVAAIAGMVWLMDNFPLPTFGVLGILCTFGVVAFVSWLQRAVRTWYHDWKWYRSWSSDMGSKIDGMQLLESLSTLRSSTAATRLLREVRRRGRLIYESTTEGLLKDVVRFLEAPLARFDSQGSVDSDGSGKEQSISDRMDWESDQFRQWLVSVPNTEVMALWSHGQGDYGALVVDELAKLVEQGRFTRVESSVQ